MGGGPENPLMLIEDNNDDVVCRTLRLTLTLLISN
jgi:hypothetical protein